jgi:hypothetical protein
LHIATKDEATGGTRTSVATVHRPQVGALRSGKDNGTLARAASDEALGYELLDSSGGGLVADPKRRS